MFSKIYRKNTPDNRSDIVDYSIMSFENAIMINVMFKNKMFSKNKKDIDKIVVSFYDLKKVKSNKDGEMVDKINLMGDPIHFKGKEGAFEALQRVIIFMSSKMESLNGFSKDDYIEFINNFMNDVLNNERGK